MHTGKNIVIGVIYRPPNAKMETFQNAINKILEKIEKENKICYLMGDFNIDSLKSESCGYASLFTMGVRSGQNYDHINNKATHTLNV